LAFLKYYAENHDKLTEDKKPFVATLLEEMLEKSQIGESSHQVQTQFSIHSNITDILKVYAKIAVNCLAKLKGYEYVMGDAFNEIKHARPHSAA